jgi:cytochrome b561
MNTTRYTTTAIALHWLMAALILSTFCVGLYMSDLTLSPTKLKIYSWHKWAGVTAFILVFVRLAWRATHRPPPLPAAMPRWQLFAAHAGHAALYVLMVAIPISGWLMSSAKGFQTVYFGVLPIPDLLAKNKELGDTLRDVHQALNFLMITVVAGHIGAALWHHFIDRDDVLTRISPRHSRKEERA